MRYARVRERPQHAALQKILEGDSSRQKKENKREEAMARRMEERAERAKALALTHVKSKQNASGARAYTAQRSGICLGRRPMETQTRGAGRMGVESARVRL